MVNIVIKLVIKYDMINNNMNNRNQNLLMSHSGGQSNQSTQTNQTNQTNQTSHGLVMIGHDYSRTLENVVTFGSDVMDDDGGGGFYGGGDFDHENNNPLAINMRRFVGKVDHHINHRVKKDLKT